MGKYLLKPLPCLIAFGALLASCSEKEATATGTVVTRNDFENVLGWDGNANSSLTTERAHSGKYAVRVSPQNEYSCTYIQTLGQMSLAKIKTVTVSAWVWVPDAESTSNLVLSINRSSERSTPVFYGNMPLGKAVKSFKTWQAVSQTFTLPDSVQATNQLKCYLWAAGTTENVYADDVVLSVGN